MADVFNHIVRIDTLPREGQTFVLNADEAERKALARSYKLPSIEALTATLKVRRTAGGARVTGAVHGELHQTCVLSLDAFPAIVEEEVDVRFAPVDEKAARRPPTDEPLTVSMAEEDEPDPLIDGRIDLGALAAEFFALGLDPYPRKPGAAFDPPAEGDEEGSPFAALRDRELKEPGEGG
jgi:Large ribosomal RNA subunit accumulation protein YceD